MKTFFIATLFLISATGHAQNAPKAIIAEPVTDAGRVFKGDKITQEFSIRNEGNADLLITDVKASCSCTAADFDKTIAPGKTGKVKIIVDPSKFNGPITKTATVITNDPANAEMQLTVKANIFSWLEAKPGYARFLVVQGEDGGTNEAKVLISSADGAPFKVLSAESDIKDIKVSWHEAVDTERNAAAGRQWVVLIRLPANANTGPLADYVKVQTDHPKQNLVEIAVSGFVRPMFSVTPVSTDFGNISLTEPLKKNIIVHVFATNAPKILSAETNIRGIDAEFKQYSSHEYEVTLTLQPAMAKGPFAGKLLIHTDSKFKPVIEVELKGNVE